MPPVTPSRILRGCGLMGRIMGAAFERIKRGTVSRYSAPAWGDPPAQSEPGPPRGQRMSIRQWPQRERPREKLLERGPSILTEAELLAILLRTGVRGHSALDVARQLLIEFGSLRGLLTAEAQRLCATRGL